MLEVNFDFGTAGDNYYFWVENYKQSGQQIVISIKTYFFLTLLNTFYHNIQHLSIWRLFFHKKWDVRNLKGEWHINSQNMSWQFVAYASLYYFYRVTVNIFFIKRYPIEMAHKIQVANLIITYSVENKGYRRETKLFWRLFWLITRPTLPSFIELNSITYEFPLQLNIEDSVPLHLTLSIQIWPFCTCVVFLYTRRDPLQKIISISVSHNEHQ